MSRSYTITVENQAVAAADGDVDLAELIPADDKPFKIMGFFLAITTELQEAQEEWLRLKWITGHTTSSNGTSTTPRPLDSVDAAAGLTAEVDGATIASGGTAIDVWAGAVQVRAGLEIQWTPEQYRTVRQADSRAVLRLMAAPADDFNYSLTIDVQEE